MNTIATPMTVLASGLEFPEGPAFAPDGTLWCVELKGGALVEMRGGQIHRHAVGGAPNGLVFARDGSAWFCDADAGAIRCYEPLTGECRLVAGGDGTLDGPNDLAFDGAGRLVFTCPGNSRAEPTGTVWSLDREDRLCLLADGLFFPNGLAFSADGTRLYIAETYRQRVWIGAYDGVSGMWINPAPWAELGGPIGPDGMAFGEDGLLHVAVFGQSAVKAVAPDGSVTGGLDLAGARPTNCCFDPSGRLGLVVTEAERGEVLAFPFMGRGAALLGGWNG
ncbi:SMP-30/gluconolactonase/LRE family protein [Corticibacterium sp. UT-5YL-CI-8]|nr:SMP-30/gluconolactonase/LRE family protein [Tianweitania sp. UT-5YL-CI-8]